jgi:hypothetical protein
LRRNPTNHRQHEEERIPFPERARRVPERLLAALLLFGLAAAARAQKTDVLTLTNGDRVTGEIRSYLQGRLTVDTDHSGLVQIKWNRIVSIISPKEFDVETTDGLHHFGSLSPSEPPGKLVVIFEGESLAVGFLEVFRVTPVHQRFWRRMDGSVDLGFNYTESSNLTQLNLNAEAIYRVKNWSVTTNLNSFYSQQEGAVAAKRGDLSMRYDRYLSRSWVAEVGGALEKNVQLGLNLRTSLGLGAGRYFVQTNQTQLLAYVALIANRERPVEGESKNNTEAAVGGRYSYFMYDFPKVTLAAAAAVIPSITQGGRVRVQADASARREIVSDFYMSLSVFYSSDSRDPTTGASRHDWGPTLSVGWQF